METTKQLVLLRLKNEVNITSKGAETVASQTQKFS